MSRRCNIRPRRSPTDLRGSPPEVAPGPTSRARSRRRAGSRPWSSRVNSSATASRQRLEPPRLVAQRPVVIRDDPPDISPGGGGRGTLRRRGPIPRRPPTDDHLRAVTRRFSLDCYRRLRRSARTGVATDRRETVGCTAYARRPARPGHRGRICRASPACRTSSKRVDDAREAGDRPLEGKRVARLRDTGPGAGERVLSIDRGIGFRAEGDDRRASTPLRQPVVPAVGELAVVGYLDMAERRLGELGLDLHRHRLQRRRVEDDESLLCEQRRRNRHAHRPREFEGFRQGRAARGDFRVGADQEHAEASSEFVARKPSRPEGGSNSQTSTVEYRASRVGELRARRRAHDRQAAGLRGRTASSAAAMMSGFSPQPSRGGRPPREDRSSVEASSRGVTGAAGSRKWRWCRAAAKVGRREGAARSDSEKRHPRPPDGRGERTDGERQGPCIGARQNSQLTSERLPHPSPPVDVDSAPKPRPPRLVPERPMSPVPT